MRDHVGWRRQCELTEDSLRRASPIESNSVESVLLILKRDAMHILLQVVKPFWEESEDFLEQGFEAHRCDDGTHDQVARRHARRGGRG